MKPIKKPKLSHKLVAIVTAGIATLPATAALAVTGPGASSQNFAFATENMEKSASRIPNLITTTAFVAGIALAIAGVFKIKAHVDNPAQAPLKDGMIRLAIGGALIAFPLLTNIMVGAIGDDTSTAHLEVTKLGTLTYP